MNCKHCNAQLEENATVCPACGKTVEEATPAEEVTPVEEAAPVEEVVPVEEVAPAQKKKKEKKPIGKGPKIIIAVSLAVVLLLGIAAGALYALGFSYSHWENDIDVKVRYTAPDFLAQLSADTVVVTMGDRELTNGLLQLYFGRQLWDMVDEYGDYLSYMGLDLERPLNEQEFPYAENITWEQYFLEMAIDAWAQQQALVCMAEDEDFQYPEGLQPFLDAMKEKLDLQAAQYGFKDGDALLQKEMGASANVERYKAYSELYNKSIEYYAALYESMEPDEQQAEKYFDEHAAELEAQYGVTKVKKPVIDVRHILLIPEGGTLNETTGRMEYSEEEMAACHQKAEELLSQWKSGAATEESFAILANEHSEDPGSNTNGGFYDYVYQGDMVEAFDAWCFDESRKPGDTGVVDTEYGCHIMYFVYGADEWQRIALQSIRGEMCQEMIQARIQQYPVEVYYYKIVLSKINFE